MDAQCLAFETEERGVFISEGKPWSVKELIEAIGGNADITARSISELLQKGVLRKRTDGCLYVDSMVQEEKLRKKRALGGRLGGNPQLKDNLPDNLIPNLLLVLESVPESPPEGKGESEGETQNSALDFPASLRTSRFQGIWNDWVGCRVAMGRCKNFPLMFQKQLVWLSKFPEEVACEVVDQSLRCGWQGLFELNHKNGHAKPESFFEITKKIDLMKTRMAELKRRPNYSDVQSLVGQKHIPAGWHCETAKAEYLRLKSEVETLTKKATGS